MTEIFAPEQSAAEAPQFYETTVGDLRGGDVGETVIIAQEGVAFQGVLTDLDITRTEYVFKDRDRITASLTVKVLEPTPGGLDREKVIAEVKIRQVPLAYRLQVRA